MGAVKNFFWDEINRAPEPYEGLIAEDCRECGRWFIEDELTNGVCDHCLQLGEAENG